MPFPNYHSARIASPKKYTKYVYKKLGNGVDLVLGVQDDKTHEQSIRFLKSKWTEEESKNWLKKHNKKYISFHPAEEKKSVKEEDIAIGQPMPVATIPTTTTTTGDVAKFYNRLGAVVSRQDIKKKKKKIETIREMIEWVLDDKTTTH